MQEWIELINKQILLIEDMCKEVNVIISDATSKYPNSNDLKSTKDKWRGLIRKEVEKYNVQDSETDVGVTMTTEEVGVTPSGLQKVAEVNAKLIRKEVEKYLEEINKIELEASEPMTTEDRIISQFFFSPTMDEE